jgi:hypothetical protein
MIRFLVAWAAVSCVAGVVIGRFLARARLSAPVGHGHLLTARQFADVAGVSLAAVQAWQDEGLVPTVRCPWCGHATVPAETADRLRTVAA